MAIFWLWAGWVKHSARVKVEIACGVNAVKVNEAVDGWQLGSPAIHMTVAVAGC